MAKLDEKMLLDWFRSDDMPDIVASLMETGIVQQAEQRLREQLAAYAHEAWSGWMRYMLGKCEPQPDGTVIMPAWAVERWTRQMNTPYADLPESEKESDRAEADKMFAIVVSDE